MTTPANEEKNIQNVDGSYGRLGRYAVDTVPSVGWYWFIPEAETERNPRRFVRIDTLADDVEYTRKDRGAYVGPVDVLALEQIKAPEAPC